MYEINTDIHPALDVYEHWPPSDTNAETDTVTDTVWWLSHNVYVWVWQFSHNVCVCVLTLIRLSEGDLQRETDDSVNRNQITAHFHTRPINITDAQPLNLEYRCCRQWTEHISRLVRLWRKWLCAVCHHETESLNTNNIDLTNPPEILCFTQRLYFCLSLSNFK